jgi:hypothetical protein
MMHCTGEHLNKLAITLGLPAPVNYIRLDYGIGS